MVRNETFEKEPMISFCFREINLPYKCERSGQTPMVIVTKEDKDRVFRYDISYLLMHACKLGVYASLLYTYNYVQANLLAFGCITSLKKSLPVRCNILGARTAGFAEFISVFIEVYMTKQGVC